ncbi:hypothetical protein D3C76_900500 [compost metagenome]
MSARLEPVMLRASFHIQDTYRIFELTIPLMHASTLTMVLLVPNGDEYPGIVKLEKHLDQLRKVTNQVLVYVCEFLTPYERRSLIAHQLNFIQPSVQMFIPELALDLRERFRQRRAQREVTALFPAAQAMLLSCLYSEKTNEAYLTTNELLGDLPYSRVTLSKAVAQLASLSLIAPTLSKLPRQTYVFDGQPEEVYNKARHHLRSPVRKKIGITRNKRPMAPGVFMAGETALAIYTMLAEPQQPVWGMTRQVFKEMLELNAFEVMTATDLIEEWIEIWAYPSLTTESRLADGASLLLSLEATSDERVQIALDELRGKLMWMPPMGSP